MTVPYSPEFADLESNTALLDRLREITGGQQYRRQRRRPWRRPPRAGNVFRPRPCRQSRAAAVLALAALPCRLCLLVDVAARRLAFDPSEVAAKASRPGPAFAAARSRHGIDAAIPRPPQEPEGPRGRVAGTHAGRVTPRRAKLHDGSPRRGGCRPRRTLAAAAGAAGAQVAPDKPQEATDYASRLMKAKKKVWEEREKDKNG